MRRGLLLFLTLATVSAAALAGFIWWNVRLHDQAAAQLEAQTTDWDGQLKAAIPLGADRTAVEAWLTAKFPADAPDAYDRYQHAYVINSVEQLPAAGVVGLCDHWDIGLTIVLGDDGKVIRREASARGSCV